MRPNIPSWTKNPKTFNFYEATTQFYFVYETKLSKIRQTKKNLKETKEGTQ